MSWPDPLDDAYVSCNAQPITAPPSARPTLRDGDVECCACEERREEDDAYEHGWRCTTCFDGEHRWMCPGCQMMDVDSPER